MTPCRSGVSAGRRGDRAAAREGGKRSAAATSRRCGRVRTQRLPGDSGGGADASARRPGWLMTAVIDTTIRRLRNLRRPSAAANAARLRARGEQLASLTIRDALSADIPALAHLHVATWNATHRGGRSGGPSYELRERQWRDAFSQSDGSWFCLVIERADGALVGFAKGSRYASARSAGIQRRAQQNLLVGGISAARARPPSRRPRRASIPESGDRIDGPVRRRPQSIVRVLGGAWRQTPAASRRNLQRQLWLARSAPPGRGVSHGLTPIADATGLASSPLEGHGVFPPCVGRPIQCFRQEGDPFRVALTG